MSAEIESSRRILEDRAASFDGLYGYRDWLFSALRPLPQLLLRELAAGRRAIAVIDQSIAMGGAGILYNELAGALYGMPDAPLLASFTGGLGGRDIAPEEFFEIARVLRDAAARGVAPAPRLLYTHDELREVRKLQAIARAERAELAGDADE